MMTVRHGNTLLDGHSKRHPRRFLVTSLFSTIYRWDLTRIVMKNWGKIFKNSPERYQKFLWGFGKSIRNYYGTNNLFAPELWHHRVYLRHHQRYFAVVEVRYSVYLAESKPSSPRRVKNFIAVTEYRVMVTTVGTVPHG